jgi:hypothetical protein
MNKDSSEVQSTISQNLSYNEESSEESSMDYSIETTSMQGQKEKNRYHFDNTMVDALERIIVLKVYAHQLNRDYTVKSLGKQPGPNLFVVSANQHADYAVNQVKDVIDSIPVRYRQIFYPPFFPIGAFHSKDALLIKVLQKYFEKKIDDELTYRLQHCQKQGLFAGLLSTNGVKN